MFNILNVCNDYVMGNILNIIKRTIDLLGIFVPILLIIGVTINLVKGVFDPIQQELEKRPEQKHPRRIARQIVAAIIVFLLPFIINTTMSILSVANEGNTKIGITEKNKTETFNIATCWNNMRTTNTSPKKTNDSKLEDLNDTLTNEKNNNDYFSKYNNVKSIYDKTVKNSSTNASSNNSNNSSSSSSSNNTSSNTTAKTYDKVVLIGDSRFVGQSGADGHNSKTTYIAKSGQGLDYVKQQITRIRQEDCNNCAFVINVGVNDYYKNGIAKEYISYINGMANTMKGKIYFLSVNPVDEAKEKSYNYPYFTSNDSINNFNMQVKAGLNSKVTYLDSNSYLKANGFTTTAEGIHYDDETSRKIFNYISQYVKS